MSTITRLLAGSALSLSAILPAQAADITGAGATFPAPIYAKWAEAYKAATKNSLNYQAIGSGGGVKQILSKTVDFGASDDPTKGEDLTKNNLLQFPAVIGGIVPVVNLPGIAPGQMKLDGKVLAAIFRGSIKNWNDPAIAALNAGVKLPSDAITLVYRSDSSGTTAGFTYYLAEVDPEFGKVVGAGKTVNWPSGVGGKGNAGVAANVSKIARLDRLRRVRVRQAEQDDPHGDGQQGRQDRAARRRHLRRRPPTAPTGPRLPVSASA